MPKKKKRLDLSSWPFSSPLPRAPVIDYNYRYAPPPGGVRKASTENPIPVLRLPVRFIDAQMRYELGEAVLDYGSLGIYDPGNIPEGFTYANMFGISRFQGVALAIARGTIGAGIALTILDPQNKVEGFGFDDWGSGGPNPMELPHHSNPDYSYGIF
jgi:hypothetical protein